MGIDITDAKETPFKTPERVAAHDSKDHDVIREGLAEIIISKIAKSTETGIAQGEKSQPQQVFYNPIQQFNRDLSVLVIQAHAEDLAASRKERRERRLEDLVSKESRGRKRKREESECGADVDAKRRRDFLPENGESNGLGDASVAVRDKDLDLTMPTGGTATNADSNRDGDEAGKTLDSDGKQNNPQNDGQGTAVKSEKVQQDAGPPVRKDTFRILDALSATGLRALRYAKEIPLTTSITANDLSSSATNFIKLNVQHNNLSHKVHPISGDALSHMYRIGSTSSAALPGGDRGKYDVIDLDPYGTAVPFLDAAVQAVNDRGLLCVTCTDAAVFASTGYLEKTYSQYGGLPLKGPPSHEAGLRLILHAISASAARYGLAIEPVLSLSVDFYARVFVRIYKSAAEVKFLAGKTMTVYNCDSGCGAWSTQLLSQTKANKNKKNETFHKFSLAIAPTAPTNCPHCGFKTHLSGPMWAGPLHNPYFVNKILANIPSLDKETYATLPRIEGMLSVALDETLLDPHPDDPSPSANVSSIIPRLPPSSHDAHPFFIIPSSLSKILHCNAPSDAALRGALLHLGYRVTRSHTKAGSIRTDAPWSVIWEVMREWVRQKAPVKEGAITKGMPGWNIMRKERGRRQVWRLGEVIASALEGVNNLAEARTQIEAALYRAGKESEASKDAEDGKWKEDGEGEFHRREDRSQLEIVFDEKLGKEKEITGRRLVRYQMNPRRDWGPMSKAKD